MPAHNVNLNNRVQSRRRIAVFAFMIASFFSLLVLDLASAMPFVLTTSGWFLYITVVLAWTNERMHTRRTHRR